ncbi:hypothetical protein LguiA_002255 [Lonicera macranthoides]
MSEVVASLEVALALRENKDSSLLDEDIFDMGETLGPLSHSPPTGPNKGIEKPSLGEDTLRGEGQTPLDWETRLRISIGTARGIAYIHTQKGGRLVHGNIKASNIFLNSQQHGCISEHGLTTLINQAIPPDTEIPGYQAPEVTNTGKVSQASDVYSYGILLLELFIGKLPAYSTGRDENYHLIQWVNSVIRQEWTARVFDIELLSYPNIERKWWNCCR